jgi:hypothetical protein
VAGAPSCLDTILVLNGGEFAPKELVVRAGDHFLDMLVGSRERVVYLVMCKAFAEIAATEGPCRIWQVARHELSSRGINRSA